MEGLQGQYYKDAGGAFTSILLSSWEGELQESQETGVVAQGTGSGAGLAMGKETSCHSSCACKWTWELWSWGLCQTCLGRVLQRHSWGVKASSAERQQRGAGLSWVHWGYPSYPPRSAAHRVSLLTCFLGGGGIKPSNLCPFSNSRHDYSISVLQHPAISEKRYASQLMIMPLSLR